MRKHIRKHLPHPDTLREHRIFSLLGSTLLHPRLWHLNRHSAAGGLAIGLFASLIPGPLQILTAALLCIVLRANLPLAVIGTLFSNPLTIVPIYFCAIRLGAFVTGEKARFLAPPELEWSDFGTMFDAWMHWGLSLGKPLLVGLPLLGVLLALASYFVVRYGWEIWLRRAWMRRKAQRAARARL
ncbi:MAG: DUF2062 domain-containing protein [Candidatus Dactylopiibacterium sp.]|nr:DUF2062 domain-containing protein [Candidatus Dactylopiibacterium sp.]